MIQSNAREYVCVCACAHTCVLTHACSCLCVFVHIFLWCICVWGCSALNFYTMILFSHILGHVCLCLVRFSGVGPEGKGLDLQSVKSLGMRQKREEVHLPWGQALWSAWQWAPGSGQEVLVCILHYEEKGVLMSSRHRWCLGVHVVKQQPEMCVSSKGVLATEVGDKTSARSCIWRGNRTSGLLREVVVHESRSDICLAV